MLVMCPRRRQHATLWMHGRLDELGRLPCPTLHDAWRMDTRMVCMVTLRCRIAHEHIIDILLCCMGVFMMMHGQLALNL